MLAEKSKLATKTAAIVINTGWRYVVCNNFLKTVFTTNKTPRLCPYITKVIKHEFIWLLELKVKIMLRSNVKMYQKYISRVQLHPFKVSICIFRSCFNCFI